ncbi:GNAT family N-acetyltransferase [Alkalihalobacterium bogoriense]|uniref:GNAT family N-acetyltransferase n=1 Tax=Alkalihalobacterium bogoriense TaxID=246272 RepID=UPI0004795AE4|nr:GNAT family N-acetyltransferase [Alkalihalobacterium bogoriense]
MLVELHRERFFQVTSFFEGKIYYIPAMTVLNGEYPGRVFVDNVHRPTTVVVIAINRWVYIEGTIPMELEGRLLFNMERILAFVGEDIDRFEVYASNKKEWEKEFLVPHRRYHAKKHYESTYTLDKQEFYQMKSKLAAKDNLSIHIERFPLLPKKYAVSAYSHYLQKTKIGARIKKGKNTVTICKNNGFEYENYFFIDVDTFQEEDRGKGYASIAATLVIEYELERGLEPLWETTNHNEASHRLAMKLGFKKEVSYPVYTFYKKESKDKENE